MKYRAVKFIHAHAAILGYSNRSERIATVEEFQLHLRLGDGS